MKHETVLKEIFIILKHLKDKKIYIFYISIMYISSILKQ